MAEPTSLNQIPPMPAPPVPWVKRPPGGYVGILQDWGKQLLGIIQGLREEMNDLARRLEAAGSPTDAADPNGSAYARLKWWKDRDDESQDTIKALETQGVIDRDEQGRLREELRQVAESKAFAAAEATRYFNMVLTHTERTAKMEDALRSLCGSILRRDTSEQIGMFLWGLARDYASLVPPPNACQKFEDAPTPPPGCDRGTMVNQNLPAELCKMGYRVDHTLPPGTLEVWQNGKRIGRIENIAISVALQPHSHGEAQ